MNDWQPHGLMQIMTSDPRRKELRDAMAAELRERCPVHDDKASATILVSRYQDARAVLSDRSMWRSSAKSDGTSMILRPMTPKYEGEPDISKAPTMLNLDDEEHTRVRQPLTQALYARVAKFRPQIDEIVERTLDRLSGRACVDLVEDYAIKIPVEAIATVLGVGTSRLEEFREWAAGTLLALASQRTPEQSATMIRCHAAITQFINETMEDRRQNPRDDLITDMVRLQENGANVSDFEVMTNLRGFLAAGVLTTADLIASGLRLFLQHPHQRALLLAQPELIGGAVEEILRMEPAAEMIPRVASRDIEISGCAVAKGRTMALMVRSANHDPQAFPDPDRFDITRKGTPHLGFGGGSHICPGAPLARLEAQVAILRILQLFPTMRAADPGALPTWYRGSFFEMNGNPLNVVLCE